MIVEVFAKFLLGTAKKSRLQMEISKTDEHLAGLR